MSACSHHKPTAAKMEIENYIDLSLPDNTWTSLIWKSRYFLICLKCSLISSHPLWSTRGEMFSIAIVRVILRLVSRIFNPMENRRIKRIAAGNIRNATATWIHKIQESWNILLMGRSWTFWGCQYLTLSSLGLRLAKVVWPKSVAFPSCVPWTKEKFPWKSTKTEIMPGSSKVRSRPGILSWWRGWRWWCIFGIWDTAQRLAP